MLIYLLKNFFAIILLKGDQDPTYIAKLPSRWKRQLPAK
ncbi:hypothetical protein SAMD00020551_1744 [Mesobacillus selenatarsenatis SF-1]|uniref:Uncharacterized protein n=1 Tax=Mesobacillus selenatarsenatis (strain DSM 18680 / JCM 14380 / FERM P-15431 / SF-1) TaxID=1321606 RepID=A0A0A8X2U7_MESS1|nr:hypothetical protein SAMD00020551_1744 [Mesobacillus selenatarsenatis SF-1]